MRKITVLAATVAALTGATAASAQTASASPYVGVTAGYHDLDTSGVITGAGVSDDGAIFGVVGGVDVPVSQNLSVGVEGNYNVGTGRVDQEYGVAARVSFPFSEGSSGYIRGGYQWVDIDISDLNVIQVTPGVDTTRGDYLVGAGAEFGTSMFGGAKLRVGVDTIGFDTVRATAGVIVKF